MKSLVELQNKLSAIKAEEEELKGQLAERLTEMQTEVQETVVAMTEKFKQMQAMIAAVQQNGSATLLSAAMPQQRRGRPPKTQATKVQKPAKAKGGDHRGQKQCPGCETWVSGARTKLCPSCGYNFVTHQKRRGPRPQQAAVVQQKRRGRPPKNEAAPKRRGRPPKAQAPVAQRQRSPKAKRRGRPPKAEAAPSGERSNGKPRGRPKKNFIARKHRNAPAPGLRQVVWGVLGRKSNVWRTVLNDLPDEQKGLKAKDIANFVEAEKLWTAKNHEQLFKQVQHEVSGLLGDGKISRDDDSKSYSPVKGATLD